MLRGDDDDEECNSMEERWLLDSATRLQIQMLSFKVFEEHLNAMAIPQWEHLVPSGEPFPLWVHDAPKTVAKRLAGNGMHAATIGAVHAAILATLVVKK